jgi:hypothetical protein
LRYIIALSYYTCNRNWNSCCFICKAHHSFTPPYATTVLTLYFGHTTCFGLFTGHLQAWSISTIYWQNYWLSTDPLI